MRLKLLGFVAALAVLLAAVGWWFASPWWTLRAMREAAAAHDEKALSAHVDYPALRASVKSEIAKQMAGSGGGEAGGTLATVVAAIAGPIVDADHAAGGPGDVRGQGCDQTGKRWARDQ